MGLGNKKKEKETFRVVHWAEGRLSAAVGHILHKPDYEKRWKCFLWESILRCAICSDDDGSGTCPLPPPQSLEHFNAFCTRKQLTPLQLSLLSLHFDVLRSHCIIFGFNSSIAGIAWGRGCVHKGSNFHQRHQCNDKPPRSSNPNSIRNRTLPCLFRFFCDATSSYMYNYPFPFAARRPFKETLNPERV